METTTRYFPFRYSCMFDGLSFCPTFVSSGTRPSGSRGENWKANSAKQGMTGAVAPREKIMKRV